MVVIAKNLELYPIYRYEMGVKNYDILQNCPFWHDADVACLCR